ncbi:polysaccharide deacetylase family protein [Nocardioides sp. URHA0020]|uniref:polysaccharide deacetylase family protein n=1 Tax=Nocardioides sp. URHA0020 TaxID=1380392 RepID=UPI000684E535|nr:polysaccharide deacetylase family protein [Nocardioides sp. URHA0020]
MRRLVGLLVAVALPLSAVTAVSAVSVAASAAEAAPQPHARTPCSRGLVALTFDDGPSPSITPRLVRLLHRRGVPATFFMIGTYADAHPEVVRMVDRAGFAIGNHTWAHEDLTTRTGAQIRRSVHDTRRALVRAGVRPTTLVRPPYGAMDEHVRTVLVHQGYTPVLWTVDPRDWAGASTPQIERRVLRGVRPHRDDVVLQHDGVANSAATLRAIPTEISRLRRRGFCFAALDADGRPTPPVPVVGLTAARPRVAEGGRVRVVVRLDRPTTRRTSVRLAADGQLSASTIRFRVGRTVSRVWLRVPQDHVDDHGRRTTVTVTRAHGAVAGPPLELPVVDDDPAPVVRLGGARVEASSVLPTPVRLTVRLDRASDRDVAVEVRSSVLGTARVLLAAGSRTAYVELTAPVGTPDQPVRRVPVTVVRATGAAAGAAAVVVVRPPATDRATAAREALDAVVWPRAPMRQLTF